MTIFSHSIEFKNISKKYGDGTVLCGVNLNILNNKTTLLQLVNGLTRPCSGEVKVFGEANDYENISDLIRNGLC